MRRQRTVILFAAILLILFCRASLAAVFEPLKPSAWTYKSAYTDKVIYKLGFGLTNGLTGWTAFFFEPARENNFFAGLLKGTWQTITNTAGGAIHIVTFPVPLDVPLPDGGVRFNE
jgi:hypothetical protein